MKSFLCIWLFFGWHQHLQLQKLQEQRQQQHQQEVVFNERAIAAHVIPAGTTAMCDSRDEIIGYWTAEGRETVYDNNLYKRIVPCR